MMKHGSLLKERKKEKAHLLADIHVLVCIRCRENMHDDRIYNEVMMAHSPLNGLSFARKISQTASRFSAFAPRPYTVSTHKGI